ncbi:MAG: TonB-dependent receptor, partial [Sulfuricellaceae bacterium]|nr:TonB-dependent receptor [Sulfuricellaceae bacterium]
DAIEAGRYGDALGILEPRAKQGDVSAAVLLADMYLFLGRVPDAIALLKPHAATPSAAALLARAYIIDDQAGMAGQVLAAARAQHPQDVELILAEGDLARFNGDAVKARAAFDRVLASEPKNAEAWFGVGRIQSEREDVRQGRKDLGRAIALNPAGAGYRGELATLESFANEFDAAEKEFKEALAQQPDDYVALTGLGILQLKRGNPDAALESFLKAGVLEPRYARGALYTGVAYYQLGNHVRAEEMFRRAAEFDPKDPLPHMMLSLVAADRMELGQAVDSARRASELMPYLKSLNQLLNNQKGNANVGASLAQFGLEEWAQAYAYNAATPYWAGSHLFLADRYSGSFNKNSELFKGFLADPTVFGASNRFNSLVASPGHYATVGGRLVDQDLHENNASAVLNGYSVSALPFAYYLSADRFRASPAETALGATGDNLAVGLGAKPSHELGLFLFNNTALIDSHINNPSASLPDDSLRYDSRRLDVGANYKFSPTSQAWFKVGQGEDNIQLDGGVSDANFVNTINTIFGGNIGTTGKINSYNTKTDQHDWQLRHTFDVTPAYQLNWGLEYGYQDKPYYNENSFGTFRTALRRDTRHESREAYVSNRYKPTDSLLLQGDLSYLRLSKRFESRDYLDTGIGILTNPGSVVTRDDHDIDEWNPRLGLAWNPVAGQTLRVAAQKWRRPAGVNTLEAVDTAGVPLDDRLVALGGQLKRFRIQYEWEASARTFVQGFLDHKDVHNLPDPKGTLVADFSLEDLERLRNRNRLSTQALDFWEATPEFSAATVDTASFAVNRVLNPRLSGSLRYMYNRGHNTDSAFQGNDVPWLPRHLLNIGANWLPAARWQLGPSLTYRSRRYTDEANTQLLNAGWNLGLRSYWESSNKRVSVEGIAENLHADKASSATHAPILAVQLLYRF